MDALFADMMGEMNTIRSTKMKKLEAKSGTPEEIVERLTSKEIKNPYEVLQISPEMPEEQVAKHYRKMSILIHPDKCKHEKAADAFQILADAFAKVKDPATKDKYSGVIDSARERVLERRKAENVKLKKAKKDPLELEGQDFEREVFEVCEQMLSGTTEKADYATRTRMANEARLRQTAEGNMRKRKWEKTRDDRVLGWRSFLNGVEAGDTKTKTWGKVGAVAAGNKHHKREENENADKKRTEGNEAGIQAKGNTGGWKDTWR